MGNGVEMHRTERRAVVAAVLAFALTVTGCSVGQQNGSEQPDRAVERREERSTHRAFTGSVQVWHQGEWVDPPSQPGSKAPRRWSTSLRGDDPVVKASARTVVTVERTGARFTVRGRDAASGKVRWTEKSPTFPAHGTPDSD